MAGNVSDNFAHFDPSFRQEVDPATSMRQPLTNPSEMASQVDNSPYTPIYQGFSSTHSEFGYPYLQSTTPYVNPQGIQGNAYPYPAQSYQQPQISLGNNGRYPAQSEPELPSKEFAYIDKKTRIAVYDDMLSSPRIVDVEPNETKAYIAELTTTTYNLAHEAGGSIPYTVILELVENFIHARFKESVVSIYDGGNTIRFSDQGPGIEKKSQAQQPGFSSATSEMKEYIRGVGSGFPIVKGYLAVQNGKLLIEDNINQGTVITISLNSATSVQPHYDQPSLRENDELGERERAILLLTKQQGSIRLTDVVSTLNYPNSSVHNMIIRLVELGYLEGMPHPTSKIKGLTTKGEEYLRSL